MQYIQAHKIYIATYLTDAATRSHGGGSCPGARLRGSHVRKRTTIVTGPRVFWDPRGLALLQKRACGGQTASESHRSSKRDTARQRHIWPH